MRVGFALVAVCKIHLKINVRLKYQKYVSRLFQSHFFDGVLLCCSPVSSMSVARSLSKNEQVPTIFLVPSPTRRLLSIAVVVWQRFTSGSGVRSSGACQHRSVVLQPHLVLPGSHSATIVLRALASPRTSAKKFKLSWRCDLPLIWHFLTLNVG